MARVITTSCMPRQLKRGTIRVLNSGVRNKEPDLDRPTPLNTHKTNYASVIKRG